MTSNIKDCWLDLWKRIGAVGNPDKPFGDLLAQYSEAHRAYHTISHIEHSLNELALARYLAINPDEVEFALWYHDAIYNTRAKDNEELSASLALDVITGAKLHKNFGELVANLIIATKHVIVTDDSDTNLLVDIDLSIFGQPNDVFDEYEKQIRKEYEWVTEDAFIEGRRTIMKAFLERSSIYSTQYFQDRYEKQAELNVSRSVKNLS